MLLNVDDWLFPGELEYAQEKDIYYTKKSQEFSDEFIKSYGKNRREKISVEFQLTNHIIGEYTIYMKDFIDWLIINNELIKYFDNEVCHIEEPKIFNMPVDDIRSWLPLFDYNMIDDKTIDEIKSNNMHGKDYQSYYDKYIWFYPSDIALDQIKDIVEDAYLSASKRCKILDPSVRDIINIYGYYSDYKFLMIKNSECLYQGRSGDMNIRFVFDFKDMRITTAYPVYDDNLNIEYNSDFMYDKNKKFISGREFYREQNKRNI